MGMYAHAEDIEFRLLSEVFEPVQYMQDNKLAGPNVEFLQELFTAANIKMPLIEVYPWARSYNIAQNEKNALIFSMVRTPIREPHFIWVGPIAKTTFHLYSLSERDDIQLNNVTEAKNYMIGLIKDDVSYQFFVEQGFVENENILLVSNFEENQRLFFEGKIDMLVSSPLMMEQFAKNRSLDHTSYKDKLRLPGMDVTFYLAANPNTDKQLIKKLRAHWPSKLYEY